MLATRSALTAAQRRRERVAERVSDLRRLVPHDQRHDRQAGREMREERQLHFERMLAPVRGSMLDARPRSRRQSRARSPRRSARRRTASRSRPTGRSRRPRSRQNATVRRAPRHRTCGRGAADTHARRPGPEYISPACGAMSAARSPVTSRPSRSAAARCRSTAAASADAVPGYHVPATAAGRMFIGSLSADSLIPKIPNPQALIPSRGHASI